METFYIQIPSGKREFFLKLMNELSFVKISESSDLLTKEEKDYIGAILESENDIEQGNVISHEMLKKEVRTWMK
jgi:hypothetical protein